MIRRLRIEALKASNIKWRKWRIGYEAGEENNVKGASTA